KRRLIEILVIFQKSWFIRFDLSLWNISEINCVKMVNITNNAVERYNRRINDNLLKCKFKPVIIHGGI
ncbi:hypothetical protein MXB_4057, partial [Myxobolus squamalis]